MQKAPPANLGGVLKIIFQFTIRFDATKAWLALPGHRALRHHAQGIFEAERIFGITIENSEGRAIPVRFIGEQHVREDCRCIPTVADWLKNMPVAPWMVNGFILDDIELENIDVDFNVWQTAVAERQTMLGYDEWKCQGSVAKIFRERAVPMHPSKA